MSKEIIFPPIDTIGQRGIANISMVDDSRALTYSTEAAMEQDALINGKAVWVLPITRKTKGLSVKPIYNTTLVTWDTGFIPSMGTLQGENLIARTNMHGGVFRSSVYQNYGKLYWELTCQSSENFMSSAGIINEKVVPNTWNSTNPPNSVMVRFNSQSPVTFGFLVDFDDKKMHFIDNNGVMGAPINIPTDWSRFYTAILGGRKSGFWVNATANFGASPFAYSVPEGYLPYNYVPINESHVFLFRKNGTIYNITNNVVTELGNSLSEELFNNYGVSSLTNVNFNTLFDYLGSEIEILDLSSNTNNADLLLNNYTTEVYYSVSMDNNNYYTKKEGLWMPINDVYREGMPKELISAIGEEDFSGIFVPDKLYIKAALESNLSPNAPSITGASVTLADFYQIGSYHVTTSDDMQLDTTDWLSVDCTINQTTPDGGDIRFAFSNDGRSSWKVYKDKVWSNILLEELGEQGMIKLDVEALSRAEWKTFLKTSLDVAIYLSNSNFKTSPTVDQITFNYTKIDTPQLSNTIEVPIPGIGLRNVLIEGEYQLKILQGIAFDDATIDYNFYTTPDKIKLRPLDMGEIIGGQYSNTYAVEVINGYDEVDFNIILFASKGGVAAEEKDGYGLLYDSARETTRTRVELSLVAPPSFTPTYPLAFRLNRMSSKVFYVRMKPTLTTTGDDTYQIRLIGRVV